MRSTWYGLVAVAVLARAAAADDRSEAAARYSDGQKKYVAEDYAGAAVDFKAAYELDPDPAYLFNGAQAYRLAKQCAEAAASYRTFLEVVPDAPNADTVRGYITEMDACVRATAPPPPPRMRPGLQPAPVVPVAPAPVAERREGRRTTLAIGALGVAALGVVGGVVWQRRVGHWEREREALCAGTSSCEWTGALEEREHTLASRGQRDAALSIASFAVAGVAVAGGIYLLAGDRGRRSEHALRLVPTTNGALVRGSF